MKMRWGFQLTSDAHESETLAVCRAGVGLSHTHRNPVSGLGVTG